MSTSKTPRTDSMMRLASDMPTGRVIVDVVVARELETDLTAMTANYEAFQSEALKSIDAMNQKLSDAMDANNALVSQGLALQDRIETMLATRAHDPELIAAKAELEAVKRENEIARKALHEIIMFGEDSDSDPGALAAVAMREMEKKPEAT